MTPAPPTDITLTIKMRPDGALTVDGPIDNPVLFYGLLECAKAAAVAHQQQLKSRIVQPLRSL